ncbi:hypothetical protein E2P81_ATG01245 [Venturia nashicola]|uniref:Uncharacterized protein n=1 Tax=Venturia nashicola TaxID=86259 RepID=A0A4Z1PBN5_9PEZI|nr:hypothetical protein E6O75_ATG01275 [Venturia nashicola]TLD38702.1 hypothetical protein E2P81_ATG01245 [Venturia nashicola]
MFSPLSWTEYVVQTRLLSHLVSFLFVWAAGASLLGSGAPRLPSIIYLQSRTEEACMAQSSMACPLIMKSTCPGLRPANLQTKRAR